MNKKKLFKKKYDKLKYQKNYETKFGIPYGISFTKCYPSALGYKISKTELDDLRKKAMFSVKLNHKNSRKWKLIRKCHTHLCAGGFIIVL